MDEDIRKKVEGILKPIEDMKKAANPSGYVDPLADTKEILDREIAFENLINPTGAKSSADLLPPHLGHPIHIPRVIECPHCGKDFEVMSHMLKSSPS